MDERNLIIKVKISYQKLLNTYYRHFFFFWEVKMIFNNLFALIIHKLQRLIFLIY